MSSIPRTIPGYQDPRTQYAFTGGWVEFDIRDKWEEPPVGIIARVTSSRYEDTGVSLHDFTRIVGDVKGYVPLGSRNRILALRLRTSHSLPDDGKEVPFYLMETLGGAKDIRGFREYRFRDTRNLLVSAEYRWEVWNYVDFSFFFDAGKVFNDASDFNFEQHAHRLWVRRAGPRPTEFRPSIRSREEHRGLPLPRERRARRFESRPMNARIAPASPRACRPKRGSSIPTTRSSWTARSWTFRRSPPSSSSPTCTIASATSSRTWGSLPSEPKLRASTLSTR